MGVLGSPVPGGCGPRCPGTAGTRGWAVPVPPVGGGRWGPRRDGYRNGRTGTGPTPTRGTGTMVSPGPPLPPLSLSLSEGAERDRDRDRRRGTRRARDAPVPVPIRPPGSPCRREGRGPRGWWEVARAGLCMSLCPCVSRPRVSRVSPAVPRCPLTPQCSCPLRSPSSGGPVPTSPRFPVLVVPVCPPRSASVPAVPLSPWSGCVPRWYFPHDPRVPWSPHGPSTQSPWFLCPHVPPVPRPHGAHVLGVPACPRGISVSPWSRYPHSPCVAMVPLRCSSHIPSVPTASPPCPHIVPPCPQAGLARCQREAEEVAELMRQNVARALEREGHLEQLQSRAQDLRQAVGPRGHTDRGEGGGFIGTCKSGDAQSSGDTVEASSPREDRYRNIRPGGDSIGTRSPMRYLQSPGGHYRDINPGVDLL